MIRIGLRNCDKIDTVAEYRKKHGTTKTVVFSPSKFSTEWSLADPNVEQLEYADIIRYKHYYRLLREIGPETLLVINECLRTQQRSDLTYNCLRHYLQQARHQIVFQYLPCIDTLDDFMTILDWDTRSRFKGQGFSRDKLSGVDINNPTCANRAPAFNVLAVECPKDIARKYEKTRERLFSEVDSEGKDPHTIPRNLHLIGGPAKAKEAAKREVVCIGRNDRLKLAKMATYRDEKFPDGPYTVLEFPHNFIDFADFMALSGQESFDVLETELKVDRWYTARYREWSQRISDAYAAIYG